jgi:hypothetical protein
LQKLGVTLEASVKVQLNLKVEKQTAIRAVAKFPTIMFPIIWAEEVTKAFIWFDSGNMNTELMWNRQKKLLKPLQIFNTMLLLLWLFLLENRDQETISFS